jgi:hypothetical protein
MWPLYVVVVAGRAPKPMLTWVVGVLRRIGNELGVRHASALAEVCEKGVRLFGMKVREQGPIRVGLLREFVGRGLVGSRGLA